MGFFLLCIARDRLFVAYGHSPGEIFDSKDGCNISKK